MSALWSDPVLGPLARELYRRCGLVFEGGQAQLFRRRVERRAAELGSNGLPAYLAELVRGPASSEYERLVEILTVNETYFFREEEHFGLIAGELWPAWSREGGSPIRAWSAACSTGCEPYTLAVMLREKGLVGPGRPAAEILGTDVNGRVLDEARDAVYGEFALRGTSEYYRQKYFSREGSLYRLAPAVRDMVTLRRFNLLRPDGLLPPGGFHLILCRNVLIYFDLDAKRRAVELLTRCLRPGGVLLVGRSESLFNVPEAPPLINVGGVLVYRKPAAPSGAPGARSR
ncbi:MAG: CheR family methyltransferase [Deferrisomatales bacterium]